MAHDDKILHQADVLEVVDEASDAQYAARGTAVISSPPAPGAAYSQAEVAALKTSIDEIRAALTASGVTA